MDLARTLRIATSTPGLWERLSAGIPAVPSMSDHMTKLAEIYKGLLRRHKVGELDSGKPLAGLAVKSC